MIWIRSEGTSLLNSFSQQSTILCLLGWDKRAALTKKNGLSRSWNVVENEKKEMQDGDKAGLNI